MKELKINIAGYANTGKTTMGELLLSLLGKEGFNVVLDDIDYNDFKGRKAFFDKRLEAIKEKDIKINISTIQLARPAYQYD